MDTNLLPILFAYSGFVLIVIGFARLVKKSNRKAFQLEPVTVVLPFRNETRHHMLMLSRLQQTALENQDRWLLVDDGSESPWHPILPEFAEVHFIFSNNGSKKYALQQAIQRTENPIICTSDADCNNHENWILSMRRACNSSTNMVIGPVLMYPGQSLVSHIAAMESLALLTVTMGSAGLNIPLMCSGANLLFRKSAWQEVGGYSNHIHQASGDDVLLMHSIWLKNPKSVIAEVNPKALVFTEAPQTWTQFLSQRKRWASKSGHVLHYKKILLSMIMGIWAISPWILWIFSWPSLLLLITFELVCVFVISQFYKSSFHIGSWFIFRLLYPILFIVLPFVPPGKWKPA